VELAALVLVIVLEVPVVIALDVPVVVVPTGASAIVTLTSLTL